MRQDLADANIEYADEVGRVFDFHALRGQCASLLPATGASPKTAQTILRHSDVNLTLNAYTHLLRGQEAQAVENLPYLSLPTKENQKATGTDGREIEPSQSAYKPAYKELTKNTDSDRNLESPIGTADKGQQGDNKVYDQAGKLLQTSDLDTYRLPLSPSDRGVKKNRRCRDRTCDLLIKSLFNTFVIKLETALLIH